MRGVSVVYLPYYIKLIVMATIIEIVQQRLGYPPLQKIDPNVQETKNEVYSAEERLAQAVIPSVLAFLFKLTRSSEGSGYILSGVPIDTAIIFNNRKEEAAEKIAQYAGVSTDTALDKMDEVTEISIRQIKEDAGPDTTEEKIKTYMSGQRHNILVHLPAAMKMGDVLEDESVDDRTNKMEGPMSGSMHWIEKIFSKGDESKYP